MSEPEHGQKQSETGGRGQNAGEQSWKEAIVFKRIESGLKEGFLPVAHKPTSFATQSLLVK